LQYFHSGQIRLGHSVAIGRLHLSSELRAVNDTSPHPANTTVMGAIVLEFHETFRSPILPLYYLVFDHNSTPAEQIQCAKAQGHTEIKTLR
jgi:hypothetical protein